MALGVELSARLDELKQQEAAIQRQQKELIEDAVPEIITRILEMVEVLNKHNNGDKYSLKRGIYNVDETKIHATRKTPTAMGAPGLD
jgi:carbonic anhydrase